MFTRSIFFVLGFLAVSCHAMAAELTSVKCGADVNCAESKLIAAINDFDEKNDHIDLFGGVTLVKKGESGETAAKKSEDLISRVIRFVMEHEVKMAVPENLAGTARALVEESRTRKIKKILIPALILLKLKAVVLIPIVLTVIGLIAMKGLGAGFAALALSSFSALKSLLDGSQQKITSVGVVPAPIIHEPHWSRTAGGLDYADLEPAYYRPHMV